MNKISKLSLAIAMAGYGAAAVAAVEDAGHVQWGALEVTPAAKLQVGYDDNLYKDDKSAESSTVYALGASSEFKAQKGLNEYALTLGALSKKFSQDSKHNFTDVNADFAAHQEFNSRNRLDLDLGYAIGHDENSRVNEEVDPSAPEYKKTTAGLTYGFGSTEAKMRIDLFGDYDKQDYNRGEGQDRRIKSYGATAFYRFMPKTDLVFEVKDRQLSYTEQDSADYDVFSYLLGLNWEATAKTTGFAKLARRERTASGIDKESFNGWEVGVSYMPVDRSVFQLSANRDYGLESDDPTSAAFTKSTATTLSWMYKATSKITTNVSYTLTKEDVEKAGKVEKKRTLNDLTLSADWNVKRNVTVSLSYTNGKRDEKLASGADADTKAKDFKRNAYMLTAELAL
ncbi:hypothetical protein EOPP23_15065 [Endozoicomonas sp. OPT23]|uniref:outer membrane beta-barrel protein n=1 Tax=Endozoicomonas sp. OPT23 TaxID=2072845 RepID=UPI00129A5344|nr:outer membrane beta-barrel protein [Endozoicomonas sp. OPT23]MRI34309.1 hypothetical protein [Endozoicomonas sp. OPT23]